jgi:DNA-binding NarL/FixJ family response regulator
MRVEEAEDGTEARAKAARFQPDLVLMDIQLPGENGLDLCRCIRGERPGTTVIVCTSYDLPEYREAARRCGASHFVVKGSSTIDELLSLVGCAFSVGGDVSGGVGAKGHKEHEEVF